MKKHILIGIALGTATVARATTVISDGHVDIGIGYDAGAFHLHLHQEEPFEAEYEPGEALLSVGAAAYRPSPGGAFGPILGPSGSDAWVLGTTPVASLPFLGWGTEELDAADWLGSIGLRLTALEGPGAFSVWTVNAFGVPEVKMTSADGIGDGDLLNLVPGSHAHYFVGFTQPGLYEVSLKASGTHAVDGLVPGETATYRFQVVPEPGTWALLLAGGALLLSGLRRSSR